MFDISFVYHQGFSERIFRPHRFVRWDRSLSPNTSVTGVAAPAPTAPDRRAKLHPENEEQPVPGVVCHISILTDIYEGLNSFVGPHLLERQPASNNFLKRELTFNPDGHPQRPPAPSLIAGVYAYISCDAGVVRGRV